MELRGISRVNKPICGLFSSHYNTIAGMTLQACGDNFSPVQDTNQPQYKST